MHTGKMYADFGTVFAVDDREKQLYVRTALQALAVAAAAEHEAPEEPLLLVGGAGLEAVQLHVQRAHQRLPARAVGAHGRHACGVKRPVELAFAA